MGTRYVETRHDKLLNRLSELGVFDEADEFFDAAERGEDGIMADSADAHELAERVRLALG